MNICELNDELEVLAASLKSLGSETKFKSLLEITKEKIQWGTNPSHKMDKFMKLDSNIEKVKKGTYTYAQSEAPASPPPAPQHSPGDTVDCTVNGIEIYGVFFDVNGAKGMAHRSKISDGAIADLGKHFRFGDVVKAEIVEVKPDGKLSLSVSSANTPDSHAKKAPAPTPKKEQALPAPSSEEAELSEMFKFASETAGIGSLSAAAKEKIKEMVEKSGTFSVAMAMAKTAKSFEIDMGFQFAKAVELKMGNRL